MRNVQPGVLNEPTQDEIEAQLGLVRMVVFKHLHYVTDLYEKEDMMAWGTLGVIHALKRFDPKLGFKFSSYGSRCIHGYLLQGLRSIRKEHWYARARGHETVTLQMETVKPEDLIDKITEDTVIEQVDYHTLVQYMGHAKNVLTEKQREVVDLMLANDMSKPEVSKILGCTRQNVYLVWNKAMDRMRNYFEKEHCHGRTTQSV